MSRPQYTLKRNAAKGQSIVEQALLIALVAIVCIGGLSVLAGSFQQNVNDMSNGQNGGQFAITGSANVAAAPTLLTDPGYDDSYNGDLSSDAYGLQNNAVGAQEFYSWDEADYSFTDTGSGGGQDEIF